MHITDVTIDLSACADKANCRKTEWLALKQTKRPRFRWCAVCHLQTLALNLYSFNNNSLNKTQCWSDWRMRWCIGLYWEEIKSFTASEDRRSLSDCRRTSPYSSVPSMVRSNMLFMAHCIMGRRLLRNRTETHIIMFRFERFFNRKQKCRSLCAYATKNCQKETIGSFTTFLLYFNFLGDWGRGVRWWYQISNGLWKLAEN